MITKHALISIRLKQDLSVHFEINLHSFGILSCTADLPFGQAEQAQCMLSNAFSGIENLASAGLRSEPEKQDLPCWCFYSTHKHV